MQRASAWLARYGSPVLLLAWGPVIGDVLVALAGAARLPLIAAVVGMTVGKAARYLLLALTLEQL